MNGKDLKDAIGNRGSAWTIGITNDPERRRKEHEQDGKNTTSWREWEADTKSDAEEAERHGLDNGMKGGTGGNVDGSKTVYVYIF